MVTHTKEPVVNCRSGKNEKNSKHSFPNAKHKKSDGTIRVKTRDIENHYHDCGVYDKCVVADSLMNRVKKLPFTSIELDQSLEGATQKVKNQFRKNKNDELVHLATNIKWWKDEIDKNISHPSTKDRLLLLDFIWFYPEIPIEFIPTKFRPTTFRPTNDNKSELLCYVQKTVHNDENLKKIFYNKNNILEKLFKYYEAVNNLGCLYEETLHMVLMEKFYSPITKFYAPCLVVSYFRDTKVVDIRIEDSSFVVKDYHVEYLEFCNLLSVVPRSPPPYTDPNNTNGNKYLKIPDDLGDANPGDANPGDRYVKAIHDMSRRKLSYMSFLLSQGSPPNMCDEVEHKMNEFGGLEFEYIRKILVILNSYTLLFFEIITLFFRLLEIQKLLMRKVNAVNFVSFDCHLERGQYIVTKEYDIKNNMFDDIRQRLERKKNELAKKFDYIISMKLFDEEIGVYKDWCKFHETNEDLEMKTLKTPQETDEYLKTKMISMLCSGCHSDQSGELDKLFEHEKNKKTEKIEKV